MLKVFARIKDVFQSGSIKRRKLRNDFRKRRVYQIGRIGIHRRCYNPMRPIVRVSINSIQDRIDEIAAFGQALEDLKAQGLSEGLLSEISGMKADEGAEFARQLLEMGAGLEEYDAKWNELQSTAKDIASTYFDDQLSALETQYDAKLAEALSTLGVTAFNAGEDTAMGLIEGLAAKEAELYAKAQEISGNMSSIIGGASYGELLAGALPQAYSAPAQLTADAQNAALTSAINALTVLNPTATASGDLTIITNVDGTTFVRTILPAFREVESSSPIIGNDF